MRVRAATYAYQREKLDQQWLAHSLRMYSKKEEADKTETELKTADRKLDRGYDYLED